VLEDWAVTSRQQWVTRARTGRTAADAHQRRGTFALTDTTLSSPSTTTTSCGASGANGERFVDWVVPAAGNYSARVVGDFDTVLELRRGTCASSGVAV